MNQLGRRARVIGCSSSENQPMTEPGDTCQGIALDRSSILRTSTCGPMGEHPQRCSPFFASAKKWIHRCNLMRSLSRCIRESTDRFG